MSINFFLSTRSFRPSEKEIEGIQNYEEHNDQNVCNIHYSFEL